MYTLWIANKNYSSWSLRPWVLMRVLGIAFQEQLRPFGEAGEGGGFRDFSPSGKVPCLHDGAAVVWDSLAIAEYLAERHSGVWPADPLARAWARCVAAEMHSGFGALRNICSMNCGVRVRLHEQSDALKADLARLEELWVEGMVRHGGPWLGGAGFGAVDAFFAPVAFRIRTYDLLLGLTARAYADRLLALPAMQEWYEAALAETWRDIPHEEEIPLVGVLTEDVRTV
jgi:glutathione S-transferase